MSLLTKAQEASIIAHLKENFVLPQSGFIAGQAVASLIYKELNLNINAPINDVDVFQLYNIKKNGSFKVQMKMQETNILSSDNYETGSGRALRSFQNFRKGYRVIHSTYSKSDENVNIVLVQQLSVNEKNPIIDGKMLINSFDFNCCAVGFHIETGEFIFNNAFVEFIKSKQLRIQSAHTPYHSWLRLNKKLKDLGENIFCDVKVERFILLKAMSMNSRDNIVGQKFFDLVNMHSDKTFKEMVKYHKTFNNDNYFRVTIDHDYLSSPEMSDYSLSLKEDSSMLNEVFDYYSEFGQITDSINFVSMVHICYKTNLFNDKYTKKLKEYMNLTKNGRFALSYILEKMTQEPLSKIKGDLPIKRLNRVTKLINKHIRLISYLTFRKESNVSIDQKLELLENVYFEIKKEKTKEGLIGLLELNIVPFDFISNNYKMDIKDFIKSLIPQVKGAKETIDNKKVLKDGILNLPFLKIKQMLTVEDFFYEGKEMENCVLGHFPRFMLQENIYYFSINLMNERTTLHIGRGFNNEIYALEHKKQGNKPIDLKHIFVENVVVSIVKNGEINFSFVCKKTMMEYKKRFKMTRLYVKLASKINRNKRNLINKMVDLNLIKKPVDKLCGFDDDIPF